MCHSPPWHTSPSYCRWHLYGDNPHFIPYLFCFSLSGWWGRTGICYAGRPGFCFTWLPIRTLCPFLGMPFSVQSSSFGLTLMKGPPHLLALRCLSSDHLPLVTRLWGAARIKSSRQILTFCWFHCTWGPRILRKRVWDLSTPADDFVCFFFMANNLY